MALLTELSVPFKLLNRATGNGPYTGRIDSGDRRDRLRIAVAWEDFETTLKEIIGRREVTGSGSGAQFSALVPIGHPWVKGLYATSIDYEAVGADDQVSLRRPWPRMILTIEFGPLGFDPDASDQPYVRMRPKGTSSFMTLPGSAFTFAGNGERLDQDVGRLVGQVAYEIERIQVPSLDQWIAVAEPLLGRVNSDTVRIRGRTFSAGYLLFPTFDAEFQLFVLGAENFSVSFPLIYRTVPWNQAMRSDGTYDTLSPTPYPTAALSPLLA